MRARLGFAIVALFLVGGATARAQGSPSNATLNIQGVLRNGQGALQSSAFGLDVGLFPMQTGGTAFFTQHFPTVPVENGYFSVELSGNGLAFTTPDVWVEVQVSGDSAPLPRQHVAAAPYAFSATNATNLAGQPGTYYVDTATDQTIKGNKSFSGNVNLAGNVGIGTTTPMYTLETNGSIVATSPGATAEGNYIGFFKGIGSLPGYPNNRYPTIKTDFQYIYFSVQGAYSAYLNMGGVLTANSDRNKKENFTSVDPEDILAKIGRLPMMQWNYKGESPSIKHIAPIAQDFFALFHLNGDNDKMISSLDPSGIALVGVKALLQRVTALQSLVSSDQAALKELRAENAKLRDENAKLRAENAGVRARLDRLESTVDKLAANTPSPSAGTKLALRQSH
jgi:hypothetical protein